MSTRESDTGHHCGTLECNGRLLTFGMWEHARPPTAPPGAPRINMPAWVVCVSWCNLTLRVRVAAQMIEISERRDKLQRTRASWRKDFNAVLARDQGRQTSASNSKLALLESVRKMLDQQERHMSGEAKQLEAVSEYLRLRQDKLQIVEMSVNHGRAHGRGHGREAAAGTKYGGGGGGADGGHEPQGGGGAPTSSGGSGDPLMRRLESIENDLARVLQALRRSKGAGGGGEHTNLSQPATQICTSGPAGHQLTAPFNLF